MNARASSGRPKRRPVTPPTPAPSLPPGDEALIMHPDGWYWVAPDGEQQFGPFESAELARRERDRFSEQALTEPVAGRAAEQALNVNSATDEERSDRGQWSGEESP